MTRAATLQAPANIAGFFRESRNHGLQPQNLAVIAEEWSQKLGMTRAAVLRYLTENIHYYLDDACLEGLRLFYRYAHECNLVAAVPELHLAEPKPATL